MPRFRTIRPSFALSPAMARIGREARLLFILLWPVADDAGRLRLDPAQLAEQLFPFDPDAPMCLPAWLDELEAAGCIERYGVEGADYLRIPQWRQLQSIDRPTRSRLPAAPSEPPAREAREPREESPELLPGWASEAIPRENVLFSGDLASVGEVPVIPPGQVRGYLEYALKAALASGVHTAPARYIELMGRENGMWGGRGAPVGRKEPVESLGVPLEDLFSDEEKGIRPRIDQGRDP